MRHLTLIPSWLRFLVIFLLVIGIFFRFYHIETKVYSQEETFTSLRISGYTVAEVKNQIFNGRVINRESFIKFQSINSEKSLSDTIMSLVTEAPNHPPLYYVIARFWGEVFGTSVTALRILSALISLLVFPCTYWLCRELFNVPLSLPGVAIALMANSPIQLIYAQEAREYILWAVTILLSSASLLRAINLESKDQEKTPDRFTSWGLYGVTLALGLYTSLWSVFVAVAHGIYVIAIARFQLTETVRAYLLATVFAFVAFIPWIIIVVADFFQFLISSDGIPKPINLIPLMPFLFMQNSRIFFDLDFWLENSLGYFIIAPVFLILVGYSFSFLYRTTNYKVWLFVMSLIIIPALPLILPNLASGGIRPASEPYLIPSYIGIQLAIAYLLATQIYNGSLSHRRIWQMIMVLVIICGLVSSKVYYHTKTWWNKGVSYDNPEVAQIINQTSQPLLISDFSDINYGNVFSLSYLLEPKVRFKLVINSSIPNIPDSFSDIFLLNPSDNWRDQIAAKCKSQADIIYGGDSYSLWKLAKPRDSR